MGPDPPLPLPPDFSNTDDYVESLLKFTTSSWLLQTLCGGVHILDFYTRTPDLYSTILPQEWREWFKERHIMDILDLLMREDLRQFDQCSERDGTSIWRGGPAPPRGLVRYLKDVRKHLLGRTFPPSNSRLPSQKSSIARHIAVGMKVKKVHEVDNFARYVDRLTSDIAAARKKEITHLVDFGSGQNYLGRALAAPPYSKHIIAVESKQHNIEGAKNMDMLAKLVPKPLIMRNKKEFRAGLKNKKQKGAADCESSECEPSNCDSGECNPPFISEPKSSTDCNSNGSKHQTLLSISQDQEEEKSKTETMTLQIYTEGHGSVQYVEHRIKDGDLSPVISQILDSSQIQPSNSTHTSNVVSEPTNLTSVPKSIEPNIMVISLHSCGNLVHHGLRSLLLNRSISAVAMVGCCYNLVTERLGPPTYKLPSLRPNHPRLEATSNTFDPHGFPMSEQLATYPLPHTPLAAPNTNINGNASSPQIPQQTGIRLNITARMMAVQAPQNWGPTDSDLFFTRHFYRALLQRIFLERGVVSAPVDHEGIVGGAVSAAGHTSKVLFTPPNGRGPGLSSNGTTTPLTIGTLRKFAYKDFFSYVRAAISKLTTPNTFCEVDPEFIAEKMDGLTDEEILDYEAQYAERKKELSVMWSLMAFSAGVVEAVIVVDRWLWLKEQKEVGECWVEPVFEYGMSPRNLVVVGVKNDSS
ncbi:hypothetical protein K469DRAFT_673730 [Zopfia rhizophila CBS 207.26]|uniref:Methyltransferase domain-containing protein n=1 Tax=Zopfia rhizophila CBS 207.26 TaxID=1314779 RepID=A0A6A6DPN0_9PEZI|nr:hypothetical protein K469DRAFT_673730 [Zopfia rhizophila CBS 207.26]